MSIDDAGVNVSWDDGDTVLALSLTTGISGFSIVSIVIYCIYRKCCFVETLEEHNILHPTEGYRLKTIKRRKKWADVRKGEKIIL